MAIPDKKILNKKSYHPASKFVFSVSFFISSLSWRCHQMKTFSVLLALCEGIHQSPLVSPHKSQWCGAFMFSLICVWTNGWANNRDAGDLGRHSTHYDVTVMILLRLPFLLVVIMVVIVRMLAMIIIVIIIVFVIVVVMVLIIKMVVNISMEVIIMRVKVVICDDDHHHHYRHNHDDNNDNTNYCNDDDNIDNIKAIMMLITIMMMISISVIIIRVGWVGRWVIILHFGCQNDAIP